jgi:anti-sigma regulatory factor (Ser/Thr protein kinase)
MSNEPDQPNGALRWPGEGTSPASPALLEQAFDGGSLYALRAAVAAHAAAAGLTHSRVYDAVLAAHELAANAVRHGAGRGRLRLRADGAFLYCQVSDDGPARPGDQQPTGAAAWRREHGHGLWVVGEVADQLSIDHGPAGTTATAAFALGSPLGPALPVTEHR